MEVLIKTAIIFLLTLITLTTSQTTSPTTCPDNFDENNFIQPIFETYIKNNLDFYQAMLQFFNEEVTQICSVTEKQRMEKLIDSLFQNYETFYVTLQFNRFVNDENSVSLINRKIINSRRELYLAANVHEDFDFEGYFQAPHRKKMKEDLDKFLSDDCLEGSGDFEGSGLELGSGDEWEQDGNGLGQAGIFSGDGRISAENMSIFILAFLIPLLYL